MALTDTDIERISEALSGAFGAFPVSNLVNYGNTLLIRPGARTTHGVVFSGAEVAEMLPNDFTAFPLAVEYAADSAPKLGADVMGLYADALGADTLGATAGQTARLRARYARVTERFRYWLSGTLTEASSAPVNRKNRARRVLVRLKKIWERMGKLGVNRGGLVPPGRLEAELLGLRVAPPARRVPAPPRVQIPTRYPATLPSAAPAPVTPAYAPALVAPTVTPPTVTAPVAPVATPASSTYTPVSKAVSEAYFRDQAALERELSASMPSYGGACYYGASDYAVGQEDLAADLRAETIGYLFSAMEHDYYGIDGGEDVEFTSADFRALFGRGVGDRLAAFGAEGMDGLSASGMVDLLDGVVSSERLLGLSEQMGAARPALSRRIRKKALSQMNAAHLAKIGLEDEVDEVDEVDEDEVEEEPGEKASVSTSKASPDLDATKAKAANLQRRVLLPSVSELRSVREGKDVLEKTQRATKLLTQITDALRSVSPNGSVNYARLAPCSGTYGAEPVIVIGIQRKTGASTDLLDLLFEEEVLQVPSGYDVPDAVAAMTAYTSISDYLGQDDSDVAYMNDVEEALYGPVLYGSDEDLLGLLVEGSASTLVATMNEAEDAVYGPVFYGAANAYPDGPGTPLPPPRRVGAEVYGA
jgi:hypothetical protein